MQHHETAQPPVPTWDIFCKVIDNHGDLGVCWRLCTQLVTLGQQVRLVVDDATALNWMATESERCAVNVIPWVQIPESHATGTEAWMIEPARNVVEAFGCDLPESYIARLKQQEKPPNWLNLEYLSAERFAERNHLLPSPVLYGSGTGLVKCFYYPGFTSKTGGLLREQNLRQRQLAFGKVAWLSLQGIAWGGERLVSLFCYEPASLPALLLALSQNATPTLLLVTAGRATQAVHLALRKLKCDLKCDLADVAGSLRIKYLPYLTQIDYDHLLWTCDFNFVRGEDSFVRAIWAGKPFIWHIYPQSDGAHKHKLNAFLDLYLNDSDPKIAAQIRAAHWDWNDFSDCHVITRIFDAGFEAWQSKSETQSALWTALPDLARGLCAISS